MSNIELLIIALVSPILLVPVEKILPYPFLIEEIFKYVLLLLINKKKNTFLIESLLVGAFFNLTETFLYLPNAIVTGDILFLLERLLITGSMHVVTCGVMYFGIKKNKYLGFVTLVLAIIIHFLFNLWCTKF